MARNKTPFHSVNEILGRFLKGGKMGAKIRQYALHANWENVVGPKIAGHAVPTVWRGNILFVEVESPAWLQELRMMEEEVLEKIRTACTDLQIEKIRWILRH